MPGATVPSMLEDAAKAMLDALSKYLPPPVPDLPAGTVSLVRWVERPIGIGGIRSGSVTGALALRRKGVRLEATVRFLVWAGDAMAAGAAIEDLNLSILGARDALRALGFVKLALDDAPISGAAAPAADQWRGSADYRLLYEFSYRSTDGARSLIAKIPVRIDGELRESMSVTDEMARWDNRAAPRLVVRGPAGLASFSMAAFVPKGAPAAKVTLLRSYDGAPGKPKEYADIKQFLAAISGAKPERNAMVSFASFGDFMAAFQKAGAPAAIGDWDGDGVPDEYQPLALPLKPSIQLPTVRDRFEVGYGGPKFDRVAVVYLRATQG